MKLTKRDEKVLGLLLQLRSKPPTVSHLLRLNAQWLLIFVALAAFAIALAWWRGAFFFAAGVIGFTAATLLLVVVRVNRSVTHWPITERITDRQEIERLLGRERQT